MKLIASLCLLSVIAYCNGAPRSRSIESNEKHHSFFLPSTDSLFDIYRHVMGYPSSETEETQHSKEHHQHESHEKLMHHDEKPDPRKTGTVVFYTDISGSMMPMMESLLPGFRSNEMDSKRTNRKMEKDDAKTEINGFVVVEDMSRESDEDIKMHVPTSRISQVSHEQRELMKMPLISHGNQKSAESMEQAKSGIPTSMTSRQNRPEHSEESDRFFNSIYKI